MKIFVVIPIHNRRNITQACLKSLAAQESSNFSTIVIDDGSTDSTSEMISKSFPHVILLQGDGNLWWTGAMNMGIQHVLSDCGEYNYILALNDDLILPENYISNLIMLADKNPNTLIGSVIVNEHDRETILNGGMLVNWKTAKRTTLNVGTNLSNFPKGHYEPVSLLTGRGVLIPISVFRKLGLYNSAHYKHYGDTELSKRAEMAGYKLIVSYDTVVYSSPLITNNVSRDGYYKFSDVKKYYWNIKSNTDIRNRFWFAYDTAPNIFQGTSYFILDLIRITYHFFSRLIFKK